MSPELPNDFTFTASNLQTFRTCKYKFFLRYIQHVPWPAQITIDSIQYEADREAGVRFHLLLHQYFLGFSPEQLGLVAENDPDSRIGAWFQTFLSSPYAHLNGDLEPEKSLRCAIEGYSFMAKFDLLHREAPQLTIYDWKTSKKPPSITTLKASLQTKLYPLVLRKADSGLLPVRFVYWEVNQPARPFIVDFTEAELTKAEAEIMTLCEEITVLEKSAYLKTTDFKPCAYCEYRSHCGRGIQAPALDDIDVLAISDVEVYQNMGNESDDLV